MLADELDDIELDKDIKRHYNNQLEEFTTEGDKPYMINNDAFNEGYREGCEIGRRRVSKKFALRMHAEGIPAEEIAYICGISIALVTAWILEADES